MLRLNHRPYLRALSYYGTALAAIGRFTFERLRFRNRPVHISFEHGPPLRAAKGEPTRQGDDRVPRIVWMYWHDPEPPQIVRFVKRRIEILNRDYEVRLINRLTVEDWLPEFRYPSSQISIQHFTDVLRLDLLEIYGGVWIDASLICFSPLSTLFSGKIEGVDQRADLLAFYIERFSAKLDPPIIENWFIAAPEHSPVIKAWREQLEKLREGGERAFSTYLKALPEYTELKQNMFLEEYLVSHIALQKALRELDEYELWLERAEDEAFAFQVSGSWDPHVLVRDLLGRTFEGELPRVVKLTGYDRHLADLFIRRGLAARDSLLGRVLAENDTSLARGAS